ncbi:MAG: hypothetical protein MUC36_23250 [Planctomycetes bacterium]|jgi:hypothetical protein|nr:hypothetical protein [Planctomycetota bacterium]
MQSTSSGPATLARHPSFAALRAARSVPVALLAALALPAQQREAATSASLAPTAPLATAGLAACVPIHTQPDDGGQPYGIWAAGRDYKASFDGGMCFVPYLGAGDDAPVEWRWTTTSATVGEHQLVTRAPRLTHTAWRAEYELGALVEAYDVRPEGLEQTFVLRERPAANGELVIRGAIASVLRAAAVGDDGEVRFVDALGRDIVHYGSATAIDAAGRRQPMRTELFDGGLELRLDAAWLASARFPVVVDPLVAPVSIAVGAPVVDVAIAHDAMGVKNVWYAEVRQTGADADLRLLRCDENGQNPILVFSDITASWSSIEPALGINVPAASAVLAWTRHLVASDTRRVRVHVHDRLDLGFDGTVVLVPNQPDTHHWRPTVGHELSPVSFTSVLIAYQVENGVAFANGAFSQIHAVELACGGTGSVTAQFPVAQTAFVDHERPTLAKVAVGPTRVWTVGYQRHAGLANSDWSIGIRRINAANVVGAEQLVDNLVAQQHEMAPKLGGSDDRLMLFCTASTIAESLPKPGNANGHRIRGTRLDWNGVAFAAPHGTEVLESEVDARLELGGVDFDRNSGSHWGLGFRSNVTQNVYLGVYGFRGEQVRRETLGAPTTGLGTSVGGAVCFQADDDEFVAAYGIADPGLNSVSWLRRSQYPITLGVTASGASCTPVQLAWYGSTWVGTEHCGVQFSNAPAGSFTLVLVAVAPASLQLFGIDGVHDGCWLHVPLGGPDYVGNLPLVVGGAGSWQLSLPEVLGPGTLRFQGVNFDPASNEFFSTNRMNVPIVK